MSPDTSWHHARWIWISSGRTSISFERFGSKGQLPLVMTAFHFEKAECLSVDFIGNPTGRATFNNKIIDPTTPKNFHDSRVYSLLLLLHNISENFWILNRCRAKMKVTTAICLIQNMDEMNFHGYPKLALLK